ncbi:peptidoglycan D,D-transpeptidase FtsI family protein [Enterococcus sp. LJL99]
MKFLDKLKKENVESTAQTNKKSHIPFRLNLLFFVIFGLFVTLIVRLGYLQIAEGQQFGERADENSKLEIKSGAPRGEIYDASGKVLVGNKSNLAITYTRGKEVSSKDIFTIANTVNELVQVPADELTERDKKDYWLADPDHLAEAQKRLKDKDKKDEKGNEITNQGTLYSITVDKVTPEEINFDDHTMQAATIFKRMNAVSELNTAFIKSTDVTEDEVAVIGEHASEIPGVSTGMDWSREYPSNDSLLSILGTVSTEKAGLPAESAEEYLKKGYAPNDRVGTSYLEAQYESDLQGKKATSEVELDTDGKVVSQKVISEGEKGDNLKLTIDLEFQNKVEQIMQEQYQQLLSSGKATYSDGAYAVAMNPKNGDILALVGLRRDVATNQVTSSPLNAITDNIVPGSIVKGATITAGYETGVISGNDVLVDEPIYLAGSNVKSSYFNPSSQLRISTEQALEYSSNAYMMKLVFKMMNVDYSYNMMFPYQTGDSTVFDELRHSFGEYGLGVPTGIDLPNNEQAAGYVNNNFDGSQKGVLIPSGANLLDLSYGQYDNYTPLQMAQYAATVANNGTRVAPRLVQGIYGNDDSGNLGELKKAIEPKEMNKVGISDEQMKIIQDGFYNVVHGTSGYTTGRMMNSSKIDIAAKTGTAETSYVDPETKKEYSTLNSNVVAYAPFDDPEIAVSVVLPHIDNDVSVKTNQTMVLAIMEAYYDMKHPQ